MQLLPKLEVKPVMLVTTRICTGVTDFYFLITIMNLMIIYYTKKSVIGIYVNFAKQ